MRRSNFQKRNALKPPLKNPNLVYDLGNGARSTVRMTAVSYSRYILLHDNEDDQCPENSMEVAILGEDVSSQVVVPETQMLVENET